MPKGRINKEKLFQLLGEGKKLTECAKYFGVSPSAVHKAKAGVSMEVARDMHLQSASRLVDSHLDTVAQLQKINVSANQLLDTCMDLQQQDYTGKGINPQALALKAMKEIRGQLRLQNETLAMLAEMSAVMEFQQELISLLKEVDENVRDEFLKRISQRRALRGAVNLTG